METFIHDLTLFRQSSPFAFASTSISITTASGRVTWQSILERYFVFGLPVLYEKHYKQPSLLSSLSTLHQPSLTFLKPSVSLCGPALPALYKRSTIQSPPTLTTANHMSRIKAFSERSDSNRKPCHVHLGVNTGGAYRCYIFSMKMLIINNKKR